MIVWFLSRGVTKRRALVVGLIVIADAIVGPALLVWEWRVLGPWVRP